MFQEVKDFATTIYTCYLGCLREIDYSYWGSDDRDLGTLIATIEQSSRLKKIELNGNNISLADGRLAIAVACNSTVTEIDLSSNKIGDVGARLLADALKRNGTVRVLDLGMNRIGDEGADFLADALKLNPSLTDMALGDNKIGSKGVGFLSGALKQNRSLRRMCLGNNKVGDDGAGFLGDALKVNDTIVEINLRGGGIGSKGAGLLAEALKKNRTLRRIDLKSNQIGDEGAALLGGALEANGTLEGLDLTANDIGSEGAGSLADAIKANSALRKLVLIANRIDGQGAKSLAGALEANRTLEYLYLDGNKIDDEGGRSLTSALECNAAINVVSLSSNPMSAITTRMVESAPRDSKKERQDPPNDQVMPGPSGDGRATPVLEVLVPEPGSAADPEAAASPLTALSNPALLHAGTDASVFTAPLTVAPSVVDDYAAVADPPTDSLPEELNKVERWLQDGLPTLKRQDVAAYAKHLISDGFDSEDMMAVLLEEDLEFMKKAHRRVLLRKLNSLRE